MLMLVIRWLMCDNNVWLTSNLVNPRNELIRIVWHSVGTRVNLLDFCHSNLKAKTWESADLRTCDLLNLLLTLGFWIFLSNVHKILSLHSVSRVILFYFLVVVVGVGGRPLLMRLNSTSLLHFLVRGPLFPSWLLLWVKLHIKQVTCWLSVDQASVNHGHCDLFE